MIIGLPKEIKKEEFRVALTPQSAAEYIRANHQVLVEAGAGEGVNFSDEAYEKVGCKIEKRKSVFEQAEMIIKVKEPLPEEIKLFQEGQILYTYLHLAANKKFTEDLIEKKVIGVAYETVREGDGSLPLLIPMSQIAGRLAVQEGAKYLERHFGGRGILLGGVPGIHKGKIVVLGGGIVGQNACRIATALGAEVTVLDLSPRKLAYLDDIFGNAITTLFSNEHNVKEMLAQADLVIGAVLVAGGATPKLVTREDLKIMKKGAVLVDVAVDQGGCAETSRPTYHHEPTFEVEGVIHYCVANMPGAVPLSSTYALTSVTNQYGIQIASLGIDQAARQNPAIAEGINIYRGKLTNQPVAEAHGLEFSSLF